MRLLAGLLFPLLGSVLAVSAATAEPPLALVDVTVVDGKGAAPQQRRTILIKDQSIADIFESGTRRLPEGAVVMELAGHTVMPGLIDAHVHLLPAEDRLGALRGLLHSGVTTVRELTGDARITSDLARRARSGEIEAPAIYYSATLYGEQFLTDPRPRAASREMQVGAAPWMRLVSADSDIPKLIGEARATGATGVKLYASLDAETVAALTQEAKRQGLKVWSHSSIFPAQPGDAVAAGADSIIHAKGLIAEGRRDVPDSFAEGVGTWMQARDFAGTDPAAEPFKTLFSEMVERGTILEPALMADGDLAKNPLPEWRTSMRDWACRATDAAHRAGVVIGAGTDTAAQPGILHREMTRLVECGLSPVETIRAATLNNATAIGIAETHGSVEPGKAADLVVIAGDPVADIRNTANVKLVIKAGRVIALAPTSD